MKSYYDRNKERIKEKVSAYYYANKKAISEKRKERYRKHAEIIKAKNETWRKSNPDKVKQIKRKSYLQNQDKYRAYRAKRKAAVKNRAPSWLSKEQLEDIKDFYVMAKMFQMYTGEDYHVDHIVPLQGKKVSGLHVPWNLQVIPAKDNLSKGNRH